VPKYDVTFWRKSTSMDRYAITVEADSPEEAAEKVRKHYEGEEKTLTEREENTEGHIKEYLEDSDFEYVEGADGIYPPTLNEDD
jgi:hypothetical protein